MSTPQPSMPLLHIAAALPRERGAVLLRSLHEQSHWRVIRCHSLKHLEDVLDENEVELVLLADELLGDESSLERLIRRGTVPTVILLSNAEPGWRATNLLVVPKGSDSQTLVDAIHEALAGPPSRGIARPTTRHSTPLVSNRPANTGRRGLPAAGRAQELSGDRIQNRAVELGPVVEPATRHSNVVAVVSGPGAPGRTTIALNLAVALGLRWPTVLVDADGAGGSATAYLGDRIDPTRNLLALVYAVREAGLPWSEALTGQLQRLHPASRHGQLLCGLPLARLRSYIPAGFIGELQAELAARHRWVLFDCGADLTGDEHSPAGLHRAVLASAGHIILVVAPEALGLHRARDTLQRLIRHGIPTGNINIVVNGWDRRLHHPLAEVALALGEPLHAIIPLDARRARLALVRQTPLVFDCRSRAGRALLTLAGEIGGGRLSLRDDVARESDSAPRRRWWLWPFRNRPNIEYGEA